MRFKFIKFKFDDYFSTIYNHRSIVGCAGDWIVTGCSHTAGFGVEDNEIYTNLLSQHYTRPVHNLALGMSNHAICRHNIQLWYEQVGKPGLVIVQWPNPVRRTSWNNDAGVTVSISQDDAILQTMLRAGEQNLYADWLDSVITLNQFCRATKTPIINILFETLSPKYCAILQRHNIIVHDDKKLPGQSWVFDSAGTDGQHHSARCHQLWAERLQGIVNEVTTP
jgi:hypothetical protein